MKICFVVDNLYPHAGWGRLALKVTKEIKAQGHTIGFITQHGETTDPVLFVNFRGLSLKHIFSLPTTLWKIRQFAKNYDALVCYDLNPYGIIITLATLGLKTKRIINALGTYSLFTHTWKDKLIAWAYRKAHRVMVVSEFIRRQIEKDGFKLGDVDVVPVGVDVDHFKPDMSHKPMVESPYIVGVGAIKERKGFQISIPAFAKIAPDFPELKYVIVGKLDSGTYSERLQNMVKEYKLEGRVVFLPKVSDDELLALYSHAAFFILTPVTTPDAVEGFGMVYLEAGACGIPTIGTLNTGAEAAILDGKNGFLVSDDADDIANHMKTLLRDKNLSKKMGEYGKIRAQEFSWPSVARIYIKSIQK